MRKRVRFDNILLMLTIIALIVFPAAACSSTPPPSTTPTTTPSGPIGGEVVNSDSIVTAQIKAIRAQSSGYPWELDVLIQDSVDINNLPNPTKGSIGMVITVKTDENMTSFKVNENVTARVKYVGDVPKPGITLYMYDIIPLIYP